GSQSGGATHTLLRPPVLAWIAACIRGDRDLAQARAASRTDTGAAGGSEPGCETRERARGRKPSSEAAACRFHARAGGVEGSIAGPLMSGRERLKEGFSLRTPTARARRLTAIETIRVTLRPGNTDIETTRVIIYAAI